MHEPNLEERFARFARTNDAADFGTVFDELAPELLAIAKRLTRDRTSAEDLAQATWLAAIEGAARFDATRALKPWLVGILVRQAQLEARRRRAVRGDEVVANAVDREDVDVEARDTREFVARSVAELAPSDRAVLAPYLFDDRRAAEIARELAEEPSTIHMRLRRALARLRRLLATSLGIAFVVSLLERRALSAMKGRLIDMTHATSIAAPVSSSVAAGAMLLSAKSLVIGGCALLATLAIAWTKPWNLAANGEFGARPATSDFGASNSTLAPSLVASARRAEPLTPSNTSANVPALADATTWILKGTIQGFAANETAPATLEIRTHGALGSSHQKPAKSIALAPNGAYSVDVSDLFAVDAANQPRILDLSLDHPRYLVTTSQVMTDGAQLVTASDGSTHRELAHDFTLQLAAVLVGHVDGNWLPTGTRVGVGAFPLQNGVPQSANSSLSGCFIGEDFRIRAAISGDFAVVASADGATALTAIVSAALGQERTVPTFALTGGAAISGSVTVGGIGLAKVEVDATATNEPAPTVQLGVAKLGWSSQQFVKLRDRATTDTAGNFTISGLTPGEYKLQAGGCGAPSDLTSGQSTDFVTATAPASGVAVPPTASRIEFHLLDVDPPPASDMTISLKTAHGACEVWTPWKSVENACSIPNSTANVRFEVSGYQIIGADYVFPPPGETRIEYLHFVKLQLATLAIQLTCVQGDPITRAGFGFFTDAQLAGATPWDPNFSRDVSVVDSKFVVGDIPPDHYHVRVHPGGTWDEFYGLQQELDLDLTFADGETKQMTCDDPIWGRTRVQVTTGQANLFSAPFEFFDASGAKLQMMAVQRSSGGDSTNAFSVRVGYNDLFPNLAPGSYRLEVSRGSKSKLVLPIAISAGNSTEVTADLDAP